MSNTLKLGNGKWATGKDTLLSFSDTNNNYKPLPFSFSRASSGTVINKDGLIETVGSGEPRIDFKDNTKGALLLEPQRTNSLQYSEDFNQSSWSTPNINVTSNVTNAPNGTTTADLIEEVTDGGSLRQAISVSGQLTFSFYLKYASGTNTSASLFCTDANQQAGFNLQTGVVNYVSGSTATIENVGNGWYRCSMTFTSSASSTLILFPNYQSGIGGVYAWGSQLESNASYATSYIPTSGSGVTRVADSSSQTVPDGVIGQTEGTMFLDFNIDDISSQTQDPVLMYLKNSSGTTSYLEMYDNGNFVAVHINSGSFALTKNGLTDGRHKAAFAYKDNDFAFYVDGVLAGVNTSFTVASSQTEIGLQYTSVNYTGKQSVNDVKLYDTRLSNAELQALTTI